MAHVKISGTELLASLEEHLQHMLDCEQLLFDLHNDPKKPLLADYKNYSGQKLDQWDQERIDAATQFVVDYPAKTELTDLKNLRPVEALLAELPRLRKAAEVVKGLGYILRYQLSDSRDEMIKMHEAGKRTLRQRLDDLTDFDDSE